MLTNQHNICTIFCVATCFGLSHCPSSGVYITRTIRGLCDVYTWWWPMTAETCSDIRYSGNFLLDGWYIFLVFDSLHNETMFTKLNVVYVVVDFITEMIRWWSTFCVWEFRYSLIIMRYIIFSWYFEIQNHIIG